MQVVELPPYFLEILERCRALMVLMHSVMSTKVVLNTEGWSKEQGDGRSAARYFTFRFESQQHLSSRTQVETASCEEPGANEGHVRI
jgi:hypothetical protein